MPVQDNKSQGFWRLRSAYYLAKTLLPHILHEDNWALHGDIIRMSVVSLCLKGAYPMWLHGQLTISDMGTQ